MENELISNTFYKVPLIGYLRRPKLLLIIIAALFVIARLLIFIPPISFPYSDDTQNPTPQRLFITVKMEVANMN